MWIPDVSRLTHLDWVITLAVFRSVLFFASEPAPVSASYQSTPYYSLQRWGIFAMETEVFCHF